ncbi:hypothetical protein YC2023_048417 [Brassica napus]|uniref:Uncharacterized protein n=2 Tax=Brassica oleracea TaxID=3712 RepID=A0A0D3BPD8_BRAOL|nr:unnamed protein product [Brassica oleracea]
MVPSFVRPVMAQATRGFSRSVVSGRSFSSSAGCFYSIALGGLRSFENPKNKINAIPA